MTRIFMKIKLNDTQLKRCQEVRIINNRDIHELGEVMYEAYKGTVDYDDESIDDAIEEVKTTMKGKYGRPLDSACLVIERNERIASAIIFTWDKKQNMPLLTFSMTRALQKGKGFATKLINEGLMRLKDLDYSKCCLIVTEGNEPAYSIYKSIGFRESQTKIN